MTEPQTEVERLRAELGFERGRRMAASYQRNVFNSVLSHILHGDKTADGMRRLANEAFCVVPLRELDEKTRDAVSGSLPIDHRRVLRARAEKGRRDGMGIRSGRDAMSTERERLRAQVVEVLDAISTNREARLEHRKLLPGSSAFGELAYHDANWRDITGYVDRITDQILATRNQRVQPHA
jgi:hypothetical protein